MPQEHYIPCEATPIRATSVKSVGGEKIDERRSPLKPGHIPELAIVVERYTPKKGSPLRLISFNHGRSFELQTGNQEPGIVFSDQHGNIYTSINLKGNNLAEPSIEYTQSEPGNVKINGLQQDNALGRVIAASNLLRANHVETEWILKVMPPQELPLNGRIVTIPEFKENVKARHSEKARAPFERTKLVITVRAMATSIRLMDLRNATIHLRKALKTVNSLRGIKHEGKIDAWDYLESYLPQNLGRNLGTLHRLGLFHNYVTPHNITATGGIVDLDSVRGLSLGDRKPAQQEMGHDVIFAAKTLNELTYSVGPSVSFVTTGTTFFANYMVARGWNPDKNLDSQNIQGLIQASGSEIDHNRVLILAREVLAGQAQNSHK